MPNFTRKPPTTDFRAKPDEEYNPPLGSGIGANFTDIPPSTDFNRGGDEPVGDTQYVTGRGFLSSTVNDPQLVWNWESQAYPPSLGVLTAYGATTIYNAADALYPPSLGVLTTYGRPTLYNLDQHIKPSGIAIPNISVSATRVSNWIKYIRPTGTMWTVYGTTSVINTTEAQAVFNVTVGSTLRFGSTTIRNADAYTVRPDSIVSERYGTARFVPYNINVEFTDFFESGDAQVNQRIHHSGNQSSVVGEGAQLELGDRTVQMHGTDHLAVGQPQEVFDPAQTISNVGIAAVGLVGGASQVFNYTRYVEPRGQDYFMSQQWHVIYSNRREVTLRSASEMTAYGTTTVVNYALDVKPHGMLDSREGIPSVDFKVRTVNLWSYSINHTVIGTPALRNLNRSITFTGIAPPALPANAEITNAIRFLDCHGLDSAEYGNTWVSESPRYLTPTSLNHAEYGVEHTVTNEWRTLLGNGTLSTVLGRPSVEYHTRTVTTVGRDSFDTATHNVRLRLHYIKPRGEVYTAFGISIRPQQQVTWVRGINAPNASIPDVQNKNRIVSMWSVDDALHFGALTKVFNSDQYVDYHDEAIEPPLTYHSIQVVEYRTKLITPRWSGAVRYGTNHLYNTARVVSMESDDLSYIDGASLVADRVRYLQPHGISPTPIMRYTMVHNDAYVISTHGADSSEYGTSWVHSLDQHIRPYQFDSSEYGRPWVSESPRTIRMFSFSHYFAPHPTVELGSRQLFVKSVYGISAPSHRTSVEERRSIVVFRYGIDSAVYGRNHELWNVTPEITRVGAYDGHIIGTPSVRTQWRNITMRGTEHFYSPRHTIEFTLRTIYMKGNDLSVYGRPTVVNATADPIVATRQTIAFAPIHDNHKIRGAEYGRPSVVENAAVDVTCGDTVEYGEFEVIPKIQIVQMRVGIRPPVPDGIESVTLGIRTLNIPSLGVVSTVTQGGESTGLRMSPHTIYMTNTYPEQVGESYRHIIKSWRNPAEFKDTADDPVGIGRNLSLRHDPAPEQPQPNRLTVGHTFTSGFPSVVNAGGRLKCIGIGSWRIGWATVSPYTVVLEYYDSLTHSEYGRPTVAYGSRPFNITVPPKSITSGATVGMFRIEHFHRTVYGLGNQHTVYGRLADRDSYAWNGFAVSPPRPTIPRGIASTAEYGEHWVSYAPRTVEMEGLDAFRSEYTISQFEARMRVREVNRPEQHPTQHIKPVGIASEQHVTVPDIQLMRYYIRPDGWVDMYIKGINGVAHG